MNILENELYWSDLTKVSEKLDLSRLKGKTILVTGGLGLICSAIIDLLIVANRRASLGVRIYLAARDERQFDERYGSYGDVEFVEYDAMKPISFTCKVDYIICGAGISNPEEYVSKPVETLLSNITGVKNILEYSMYNDVKRVLYISSSEVYGKKQLSGRFSEKDYGVVDLDSIRSSYAMAKRASEMLCRSFSIEYGIDVVIVRPGHVFGPTLLKGDKRISSDFILKAARSMSLEMKSNGEQKRSYCYSIDAAAAILTVLTKGVEGGEAYNVCTNEVTTIREMAELCSVAGGVPLFFAVPSQKESRAFNPMDNSSLSFEKLEALGFSGSFDVAEALQHTIQILRDVESRL